MITTENIQEILQAPWWDTVKNEVVRTVTVRSKATHEIDKPPGSVLGEMFVMSMNQDSSVRMFVNYFLTRGWSEIIDDLKEGISPQVKKALLDVNGEGEAWFSEFREYLSRAWKQSSGPPDPKNVFRLMDRGMFQTIRKEWVKHVESKTSAGALAQVMSEWMREAENPEVRKMAVNTYAFISVRSWPEILAALRTSNLIPDPIKDLAGLDSKEAEEYYDEWKLMVMTMIDQYWDSLLAPATEEEPSAGAQGA